MEQEKISVTIKSILDIKPPKDYKVIYLNDDVTTFEFVTDSLIKIFNYDSNPAESKAKQINGTGMGIVAVLPFEIAEQKGVEVMVAARVHEYPLEVRLEEN